MNVAFRFCCRACNVYGPVPISVSRSLPASPTSRVVGVLVTRSEHTVVALLATLAAGTMGIFEANTATPNTASHWAADITAAGKSFTTNNSLTLAGTDGTTMTFPSTSATIARTDAAQTFTGVQTLSSSPILSSGAVTVSGNTVTLPTTADTLVGRGDLIPGGGADRSG